MTAARLTSTSRATTAHPPIRNVPTMREWCRVHHAPRQGWLARILHPASPTPETPSARGVEAVAGANNGVG